jgi:hypothetical protein
MDKLRVALGGGIALGGFDLLIRVGLGWDTAGWFSHLLAPLL